jgi:uncharacterized membrane protein
MKITEYCDIITNVSGVPAASIFIVEECWLHLEVILMMEAAVYYETLSSTRQQVPEDRKDELMEYWRKIYIYIYMCVCGIVDV